MTKESANPRDSSKSSPRSYAVREHGGSLRSKMVLSLAVMFLVFLTLDEIVRHEVIKPEFAALERNVALRDSNRVVAALNAKVEHLSDLASHWVSQLDPSLLSNNTIPPDPQNQWSSHNIGWAAIASSQSSRWAFKSDTEPQRRLDHLQPIIDFCRSNKTPSIRGMMRAGDQSMLMFAAVAFETQQDGSSQQHFFIVGRTIDQQMVTAVRRQTLVDFSLQAIRTKRKHQTLSVWTANKSLLVVEFQILGIDEQPMANAFVQIPRDVTVHSERTTAMARRWFIIGTIGALGILLIWLIQRIVIRPLEEIREHYDRVAEEGIDSDPIEIHSNDEIGKLAEAFDNMMHRLGDAQRQLTEASQAAGRSQVASTVIHNVGNVLTNVNSLLDAAGERVGELRIKPLSQLADRLNDDDVQPDLVKAAPDYLHRLAESLGEDRDQIVRLVDTLQDNVRHIHDVLRDQQRHTAHQVVLKPIPLDEVIREAIGCCRSQMDDDSIDVFLNGLTDAQVVSDRSLLLQTLINVIGNARQAINATDSSTRQILISTELQDEYVTVQVIDTGCGMSQETLQRVFDAHFTTRDTGSGLGLHFCANALKRIGGKISASSEGDGMGSTFLVELPIASTAKPILVATDSPSNVGVSV